MSKKPISEEEFKRRVERISRIAEALAPQYLAALESGSAQVSARTRGENADVAADRAYESAQIIEHKFWRLEVADEGEYWKFVESWMNNAAQPKAVSNDNGNDDA